MYSLKKQLNKSLIVNLILVMLVMLVMLNIFIQQLVKEQVVTRLQHDAESLVTIIQPGEENSWKINPAHISTVYNRVRSGHYYVVKTDDVTLRSRSLFDFEPTIQILNIEQSSAHQMHGAGEENWLVWQQNIHKNGHQFQIWVAEDIAPFQQQLIKFSVIAVFLVTLVGSLLVYLQQKILNKAFRVFDTLRSNLQAIRHGETENTGTQVPVEISPLVSEIEMLVEQLKQRIQRTRNAIGNLTHEIKRPLQLLSLYIETGEDKESKNKCFEEIQMIVDRELRRAKISGSNVIGGAFNVQSEIPVLLDVMQKIYPDISSTLFIQKGMGEINLDRDDMLELSGNLIDNACKYASKAVKIEFKKIDHVLFFSVDDDGKGVDKEQISLITRKGYRLDESHQGHGLGLSICSDIIQSYHGELKFDKSPMNGLKVTVSLPLSG